jgi:periplasmic protein TonB
MKTKRQTNWTMLSRQFLLLPMVFLINYNGLNACNKIQLPTQDSISDDAFDTVYYVFPEQNATFNNGTYNDFHVYTDKNLTYPSYEKEHKIEGKTFIQFGVNCHGDIGFVKVQKSSGNINLDNEAIRVVKSSPEWKPAKMGNKFVGQIFIIPINFKL